ncbi:hypothetical protein [Saccharomonospora sp. CUA-673]|uniref:hypothetical protein n=1 Tax=Saccharomonospora sp. CUA-673 TaxID=1904969 RepID=UPI0035198214
MPEHDAGPPTMIGNMPPQDPELDDLQDKLDELAVPDEYYVLGMPAEHGWSIERVAEGWRVGWYEGGLRSPAVFGDAADAKRSCSARCCSRRTASTTPRHPSRTSTTTATGTATSRTTRTTRSRLPNRSAHRRPR